MPNYQEMDQRKQQNPMLGLIGFIVLVILGGISFAVSGPAISYLSTTSMNLGPAKLLPIVFPPDWSPLGHQLAVSFGIFMILFIVAMIILFTFMKPATQDERDVSLDVLRREVEARKKRH